MPRSTRLSPALVALCLTLVACGDDPPAVIPPLPPASYTLSDGTRVDVDGRGALALFTADGRALASTTSGGVPTGRSFDESVTMNTGFFRHRRTNELVFPASRFLGSEATTDGVALHYSGAGGVTVDALVTVATAEVSTRLRYTIAGPHVDSLALPFACDAAASFTGFGAQYNATDQRGEAFPLWSQEQGLGRTGRALLSGDAHTTYFPMPWWLDWRGFGVLVDTPARTLVDLCKTDASVAWVEVEDAAPLDVLVFHGPRPADVVRTLGDEIGRAKRPPDWAFSPWMGMQGGRAVIEAEVAALEAASVPFSAIWVQDWCGGGHPFPEIYDVNYRWLPDETLYPDLAELVSTLRADHNVRFLAYANSFIVEEYEHFAPMAAQGLLIRRASGETYTFPATLTPGSLADFTNPATYDYTEGYLRAMVSDLGFDGWMADFGEWLPPDALLYEGDARLVHNLYPALWHKASRDVMDELRPDGDWVVFTRSGWTRDHAVQQVVWIGDQEADFLPGDGLPTVVPAILNLGLSGVPFVTHDIAGYSGGPSTKELYFRWTELGAFTPIMRTHDGLKRDLNWRWDSDAETTAHFARFARIHQALAPEFRALADEAAVSSTPMIRHLAYEFPEDVPSRAIDDEYMLGSSLLVAPVVEEGAVSRSVYLPPGRWFDVWTGTGYDGGVTITVDAPLGSPPVFSKDADRADLRAIL
jgi:alpha-glucosidase